MFQSRATARVEMFEGSLTGLISHPKGWISARSLTIGSFAASSYHFARVLESSMCSVLPERCLLTFRHFKTQLETHAVSPPHDGRAEPDTRDLAHVQWEVPPCW